MVSDLCFQIFLFFFCLLGMLSVLLMLIGVRFLSV
jgi:hypothetical protein